jgi:hypothetical protein
MRHRTRILPLLACLAALASFVPAPAGDEENCWPGEAGTDPALCPPDDPRFPGRWEFRSDIPPSVDRTKMHPAEVELGSIGFSLDRAWQLTLGRDDVVIAVLDSGTRWDDRDLLHKYHLNAGELPPPAGSVEHDANGDGVFDVRDYAGDERVRDRNANGVLDPQDLILAFSDCRDDDGNGYPDDVCGYDFFGGEHCGTRGADNDARDDTDFGHGTGIASTAAAETNNGIGDAGVCPKCRVMPVRIGDSFVVDANRFAHGLVFAARTGASVVASAVGSYNNTPAARAALDFAYERGVAVIASAADEFSYHHNYPSVHNHALYVNAVRDNHAQDHRKASTFWGLNPCTNFGARVWVTVPARSCSSGATSRLAGLTGLLYSAALEAGLGRLEAEEAYQLLRRTADDLDNSAPDWGKLRWPAKAGFDQLHGYGRVNAHRAVGAVLEGRIPPIADLANPEWFAVVSPVAQPVVPVGGTIRLPRAKRASYTLEYALGVEPRENEYRVVARGDVQQEKTGNLGLLDFTKLPLPGGPPPVDRESRDRYSVSLRLRVTDDRGLTSEARRSFFVFHDPSWFGSFPLQLGASGEAAPVLADLDGDGADEIVLPTADGLLRIVRRDGGGLSEVRAPLDEGFPAPRGSADAPLASEELRRETVVRAAAVGDLAGRGAPVVVVASREGKVYVFDRDGERVAPFPVSIDPGLARDPSPERVVESGILTGPVLADLDGRPGLEIVVTALDGHVHAWRGDGTPLAGFPVLAATGGVPHKIVSTPAVGDVDGDGSPEIVFGTNGSGEGLASLFAVRAAGNADPRGAFLDGWAPYGVPTLRGQLLPTLSAGIHMTPVLVDADADGDQEVVVYAVTGTSVLMVDHARGGPREVARYDLAPSADSEIRGTSFVGGTGSALLADTDGDGAGELYAPLMPLRMLTLRTSPGVPIDVPLALGGWKLAQAGETRPMLPGWPRRMEDLMLFARPAAVDVDSDGRLEVVMGSGGYLLHAFRPDGGEAEGFPKFTGGWIFSAAAAGDLDGDGRPELVAVTREGYLFAWKLGGTEPAEKGRP